MKQRKRRLENLLTLARRREHLAAAALAQARRQLAEHEENVNQLRAYRRDYARQLIQRAAAPVLIGLIQGHHRFVEQLDTSIDAQGNLGDQLSRRRDQQQEEWLRNHQRVKILEKALDNSNKILNKKEESLIDLMTEEWLQHRNSGGDSCG